MLNARIAQALREHAKAAGVSYKELASRLGLSAAYVSMLLNGRKVATPTQWERVAEALGYDLRSLLAGDEQQELAAIRQRLDALTGVQTPERDLDPGVKALYQDDEAGELRPRLGHEDRAFMDQFTAGKLRTKEQALAFLAQARALGILGP